MDSYPEQQRGPSIIDTAISIEPRRLIPLKLKLHEYRHRMANQVPIPYLDERSLAVHGFARLHGLFKRRVLEVVVNLAETEGRETRAQPIALPEVAWYFERQYGVDVSHAVYGPRAVPFLYDSQLKWYMPHFNHPASQPNDLNELFIGAYGVIRAYASNRLDTIGGGTGLATIPRRSAYYDEFDSTQGY